ncbi:uncharacterized protein METZ01_LOCUS391424, partial [marine metagenome]
VTPVRQKPRQAPGLWTCAQVAQVAGSMAQAKPCNT